MAPIAKDVETPTRTTSAVPSPAPTAQTAATRPQPVPLEVPVSVNGARTIEGSDKREPFSESTKTVLVFANGAVIRLASSVSPGQLLFVTNEKSKKEVVCQVVKSKNYRTVTGYVELEFTEPAAGFWGVRIPTESAANPATPVKAPAVARPVASDLSPAAAPPKPFAATPVAPVSTKPNLPVAAPVKQPAVVRPVSPSVPPVAAKPEANRNALPAKDPEPSKAEIKVPTIAEFLAASPVAPPQPPAVNREPLPAQQLPLASQPAPKVTNPPAKTKDATTDELRQQAARLQEQLSSLLFREEALEKGTARPVVAPPVEPIRELVITPKPAAEIPDSAPLVAPAEISTEVAIAEVKPLLALSPAAETKPSAGKPAPFNLKVEEVKIPSWLAPLAREADAPSPSQSEISENTGVENNATVNSGDYSSRGVEEKSTASEAVVFGGQLLGGAAATDERGPSPGSKKGLILGLAAAIAIVIGGGVWYGLQPGNFLAGKARTARTIPASNFPELSPAAASPTAPGSAPNGSVASVAASPSPAATQPAKTPVADGNKTSSAPVNAETKSGNSTVGTEPTLEQQKKPVLGEVHLATPNVNHGENSVPNEAAPSIDSTDAAATGDQLVAIAAGNESQPAAPLPVGGEVKPAELRKSVPPVYPPTAKSQRVAGDVKLDALIDADGNVTTTRILSGPVLLHQAAAAAVKQWKYQPAVLDGKPTAMHLTVTVQFRLE